MATSIDTFLTLFPEFQTCDSSEIQAVFAQVQFAHNCFGSIQPESVRDYANYLAVAHYLQLRYDPLMSGGQIKSIRNRNDTVSYAVSDSSDPYGWKATIYGTQLASLLKTRIPSGFVSQGGAFKCL